MLNDAGPEQFSGIYIRPGRTDCRKGARGLSEMIQFQFSMSPYQKNVLFLFCGCSRKMLKALVWEGLSVDFCYPHIFRLIRKTRSLNDMYFVKCADNTFYRRPQRRASSSSSSGHSGSSFPDEMTPVPFSIAARFCSNDGNA